MDSSPEMACSKHPEKKNELSLGVVLFQCMKKYSKNILQYIADTDETDTYEQVLIRSIRTALKLKEKGIIRKDIISTCTYRHKNSCVPFVASWFLGAIPANFDPNLSRIYTVHLLKLVQPKIIFVSADSLLFMEQCLEESNVKSELVVFGNSKKYSQFSEYLEPNTKEEDFRPVPIEDSKETAIIMFSSGTTGLPKGICLSHSCFLTHLSEVTTVPFLQKKSSTEQSVGLLFTTFYWITAVEFFIKCVIGGDALVVCSKFDALNTWRAIEKYKITFLFLAPHLANEFLNNRPEGINTNSLNVFLTSSSAVSKNLMDRLRSALPNTKVLQSYGQTEAAGAIAFFNPQKPEDVEMQIRKPLSCGRIRPGLLWKIVDPDTEEILGPNQRGELRLKSDFLMNGYYNIDSSSAFDSEGYLKTGDIVYYDEEQCLFVVDRIKEMFKYKGWHILPVVLEDILKSHPAIKDAIVFGIPHETDGEHPMGIVVLNDGHEHVTPRDIELFVEKNVPEIQRLRAGVKIVNEISRTTTSKPKRNAMKKMVLNGEI